MKKPTPKLDELPPEILHGVFEHVSSMDLLTSRLVSKRLCNVVLSAIRAQLGIFGNIRGNSCIKIKLRPTDDDYIMIKALGEDKNEFLARVAAGSFDFVLMNVRDLGISCQGSESLAFVKNVVNYIQDKFSEKLVNVKMVLGTLYEYAITVQNLKGIFLICPNWPWKAITWVMIYEDLSSIVLEDIVLPSTVEYISLVCMPKGYERNSPVDIDSILDVITVPANNSVKSIDIRCLRPGDRGNNFVSLNSIKNFLANCNKLENVLIDVAVQNSTSAKDWLPTGNANYHNSGSIKCWLFEVILTLVGREADMGGEYGDGDSGDVRVWFSYMLDRVSTD